MPLYSHPTYPNFHLVEHPLVAHKLTLLRDKNSNKKLFKELVHEITLLLAYEATANLPLLSTTIETPLETAEMPLIAGKKSVILPILRAGLGMVDAFLSLMPGARVGHIGMYRDEETLEPHTYFFKIPPSCNERIAFILDPMLATGGSTSAAITRLKSAGLSRMKLVCLLASPEGVERISKDHPDVKIFSAALDRELDEHGYIRPGLGDAGNRLFGTR